MPRVATNVLCQPEKNTFAKEGRAKEQKNLQTDQLNNPKAFSSIFQFLKEKNDVQSLIWFG